MTVPKKLYFIKENIVIKESGFVMTRIEKKEILSDEKTKKDFHLSKPKESHQLMQSDLTTYSVWL